MKNKSLYTLLTCLLICSCTPDNPSKDSESESQSESQQISESESESISESESVSTVEYTDLTSAKFTNMTVEYDGKKHSIYVENIPSTAKVTYKNNDQVEPGTYKVTATIKFNGETKNLYAKIIINKKQSVLEAETCQTFYISKEGATPAFTLNNSEQVINFDAISIPGTYEYDLYASASDHYAESNHVKVKINVLNGEPVSKIEFNSAKLKYNGLEQGIVCENIPEGYSVEYTNNKATEVGTYIATATIKKAGETVKTLNAKLVIDNPINQEFQDYLDEFFVEYLDQDYLAWNIFTVNAEDFGFVRDEESTPKWYTYETIPAEDYATSYTENLEYHALLTAFDKATLSYEQIVAYNAIDNFFTYYDKLYEPSLNYNFLMELNYVDQFGGYAAEFNTEMEAYSFRKEQDIKDALSYINSIPEAFESYILYVSDREKANYPLSDFTLNEMISYLKDSAKVKAGENFYLIDVLANKVDQMELSDELKESYKKQLKDAINDKLIPSYTSLATGLEAYKGKCSQEGYLAIYDGGEELFELNLKKLLGIWDLDLDDYAQVLSSSIDGSLDAINSAIKRLRSLASTDTSAYNAAYGYMTGGSSIVGIDVDKPYEMIDYLKSFATTIVTPLDTDPEITVKYMDDASAKVSNAVAYYMKSALDSTAKEYITLNPEHLDDPNDTIATMAHEGYPGHLYAYLYEKQSDIPNIGKIMTSTAHGEGWSTYVQLKLYEYMKTHNKSKYQNAVDVACDYLYYNQLIGFPAYAYMDYLIHIKHYTVAQIHDYMDKLGFNSDMAEDLYRTLIETPVSYAAYGYGMILMNDLHSLAKMRLKNLYNEIEFNKVIHSNGWCGLGRLQEIVDEYVETTIKLYGDYKQ